MISADTLETLRFYKRDDDAVCVVKAPSEIEWVVRQFEALVHGKRRIVRWMGGEYKWEVRGHGENRPDRMGRADTLEEAMEACINAR
jgi:hypothetical protein